MRPRRIVSLLFAILVLSVVAISVFVASQQKPGGSGNSNQTSATIAQGCGSLFVHVINVSQADSVLIITPGNKTILIDAGSDMKTGSSANVVAYLKRMNVSKIDYLIASHYHEDHIGGMDKVFGSFAVDSVYDSGNCAGISTNTAKEFAAYKATANPIEVKTTADLPSDGCLSEAKLIFPHLQKNGCSKSDENDNSVLMHLTYGNTSFLFTGDCDEDCENAIMQEGVTLKSDFLKVGHHGSDTSSSEAFLDAVGAKYYAISTDRVRSVTDGYFHPRESVLESLYSRAPRSTYRTDLNGDITAVSDGKEISISSAVQSDACDTFSGYAKANASSYSVIPSLSSICN